MRSQSLAAVFSFTSLFVGGGAQVGGAQGGIARGIPTRNPLEENVEISEEKLKRIHSLLDYNHDGKASILEMMAQAKEIHYIHATREIAEHFNEMDKDEDSRLSLEEFIHDVATNLDHLGEGELNKLLHTEEAKFKLIDTDGDGKVSRDEAIHLVYPETHPGVLDVEVAGQMRHKDTDGDGKLTRAEFHTRDTPEAHTDFHKLDEDKDGFISFEELREFESGRFHVLDAARGIWEAADASGDGHLSAEELLAHKDKVPQDALGLLHDWLRHAEL